MTNIQILRFPNHPQGHQGALKPDDGRWQLVIDAAGDPHLFLRVRVDGALGWLAVDDLLPGDLTCAGFIDGEAGEPASPEDAAAMMAELATKGERVCPAL